MSSRWLGCLSLTLVPIRLLPDYTVYSSVWILPLGGGDESLAEKDPELEGHSNPLDSELGSAPLHPEDLRKLLKSEGRAGWIVTA